MRLPGAFEITSHRTAAAVGVTVAAARSSWRVLVRVATWTAGLALLLVLVQQLILPRLPARGFANGSFEAGYLGWNVGGHQHLAADHPTYPASDGSTVVVFDHPGNLPSQAVLSRTVATVPGQRYGLSFDLGTVGRTADQAIRVSVAGNRLLMNSVFVVASADGTPPYTTHHVSFVADAARTTLTFADVSSNYWFIDALLDNVRLGIEHPDAPLVIRPPRRTAVADGAEATFTVEASGPGPSRYQWRVDGTDIPGANGQTYTIAGADGSHAGSYSVVVSNAAGTVTSSSARLSVLPRAILLNGSFEHGSAAWTFSNDSVAVSTNTTYGVTDGAQLVHFNWGQQEPNGSVSQAFATVPGQEYVLAFDVGAFSLLNQYEQRLHVTVEGEGMLLSARVSVFAPGNGWTYRPQTFTFVADDTAAVLTFRDASPTTENVDLLLDNVRVMEGRHRAASE